MIATDEDDIMTIKTAAYPFEYTRNVVTLKKNKTCILYYDLIS